MNQQIPLMLLQFRWDVIYKEDDPLEALVLGIVIGAIIVVSVIIGLIRRSMGQTVTRSSSAPRYGMVSFRRLTSTYGLDNNQSKLLESIFRANGVGDPARVLRNPELVDRHFERAYKTIERTTENDEEMQQKLLRLFSLRNTLESSSAYTSGITTTSQIAIDTPVILSTGKENYTIRVISAKGESLITEYPRSSLGTAIKLPKGHRVSLSFFTQSSQGFSFESRVIGNTISTRGPALELSHSGKPKVLAQRRFRRKEISIKCNFQLVFMDNQKANRKQPPKLIVDPRRYNGTILNISAGGCSMKTSAPLQVGSRLRIEIAYSDESMIAVLGQTIRSTRNAGVGTIIHIRFLKVPRRAFNNINALVFGYD